MRVAWCSTGHSPSPSSSVRSRLLYACAVSSRSPSAAPCVGCISVSNMGSPARLDAARLGMKRSKDCPPDDFASAPHQLGALRYDGQNKTTGSRPSAHPPVSAAPEPIPFRPEPLALVDAPAPPCVDAPRGVRMSLSDCCRCCSPLLRPLAADDVSAADEPPPPLRLVADSGVPRDESMIASAQNPPKQNRPSGVPAP